MKASTVAIAAVSLSALAACRTDAGFTGQGPVVLSDFQQWHFEEWSSAPMTRDPLYFFLLKDGRSYSVYCTSNVALCRDASEREGLRMCEERNGKGACKLYGVYGQVVWNFDGAPMDDWTNNTVRAAPPQMFKVPDEMLRQDRTIIVHWEGRDGPLRGKVDLQPAGETQKFRISFPGPRKCDGSADFRTRTWRISCDDGNRASGTFTPLGRGKGSYGEGVDKDGRKVTYDLLPAG